MKKLISILSLFTILSAGIANAQTTTFDGAMSQSKPMAVLVYANWADDAQTMLQTFGATGLKYSDKYNFVTLDIASPDAKAFNKTYYIYPNLPYVLLFRDKGKVSRYLKKDCALDQSCFEEKLKFFVN